MCSPLAAMVDVTKSLTSSCRFDPCCTSFIRVTACATHIFFSCCRGKKFMLLLNLNLCGIPFFVREDRRRLGKIGTGLIFIPMHLKPCSCRPTVLWNYLNGVVRRTMLLWLFHPLIIQKKELKMPTFQKFKRGLKTYLLLQHIIIIIK